MNVHDNTTCPGSKKSGNSVKYKKYGLIMGRETKKRSGPKKGLFAKEILKNRS